MTGDERGVPRDRGPSVVALIPAYNERRTIAGIVARTVGLGFRTIVIDDGSSDDTAALAAAGGADIVRHKRNLGKGAAIYSGLLAARDAGAQFAVTLDGDGQHRPEDIARLIAAADAGAIVIGSRARDAHRIPRARHRANRTANFFVSWAAGHWIEDTQCGFRVYPVALLRHLKPETGRRGGFVFESDVLIAASRAGYRTLPVEVPAIYGKALARPSHLRPVRDIAAIVVAVAWRILARGFHPSGYLAARRERRLAAAATAPASFDPPFGEMSAGGTSAETRSRR